MHTCTPKRVKYENHMTYKLVSILLGRLSPGTHPAGMCMHSYVDTQGVNSFVLWMLAFHLWHHVCCTLPRWYDWTLELLNELMKFHKQKTNSFCLFVQHKCAMCPRMVLVSPLFSPTLVSNCAVFELKVVWIPTTRPRYSSGLQFNNSIAYLSLLEFRSTPLPPHHLHLHQKMSSFVTMQTDIEIVISLFADISGALLMGSNSLIMCQKQPVMFRLHRRRATLALGCRYQLLEHVSKDTNTFPLTKTRMKRDIN